MLKTIFDFSVSDFELSDYSDDYQANDVKDPNPNSNRNYAGEEGMVVLLPTHEVRTRGENNCCIVFIDFLIIIIVVFIKSKTTKCGNLSIFQPQNYGIIIYIKIDMYFFV